MLGGSTVKRRECKAIYRDILYTYLFGSTSLYTMPPGIEGSGVVVVPKYCSLENIITGNCQQHYTNCIICSNNSEIV